jgi:hypothetical protein
MEPLDRSLARFDPISLEEMDRVKLQDRTDTKFVFGEADLGAVLDGLLEEYRLLVLNGARGSRLPHALLRHARTAAFLRPPQRPHLPEQGALPRIRGQRPLLSRSEAQDRPWPDLESTVAGGRHPGCDAATAPRFRAEGERRCRATRPMLWNMFMRLTFVHRTRPERLTIDRSLGFTRNGRNAELEGICIAELKQEHGDRNSPFLRTMRAMGHRPSGMSKYCVGMWLLEPGVKYNGFKELFLKIERLRTAA